MTSKQAAAYRQQRIITSLKNAIATRHPFGRCQECGEEELLSEWLLCRHCNLDAEYSMSGEANPPAAPDTTPSPAPTCKDCGAAVDGDEPTCDACYRPSAESVYDERNHVEWNPEDA